MNNLYLHFPFCRTKCSYCALHSRGGSRPETRTDYVARLVRAVDRMRTWLPEGHVFRTVYFGGGSPALCDLEPLLVALRPCLSAETELTVELHPLDVMESRLDQLRDGGVNRISMGVESVEDEVLSHMRRGYSFAQAERAFQLAKTWFRNAGIDLIVGYPGERLSVEKTLERLTDWGFRHCSAYSLILEPDSLLGRWAALRRADAMPPDDGKTLDRLRDLAAGLAEMGFERYEVSNYARPGSACRHNLAVWRGEDYIGLGEGAHGRIGLLRTCSHWGQSPSELKELLPSEVEGPETSVETVSVDWDVRERRLFRLRTSEGLDAAGFPQWRGPLDHFVEKGLLTRKGEVFFLTERGFEVCDSILEAVVCP